MTKRGRAVETSEEKKQSGINYDRTAFILKRSFSDAIFKGPLRLKGRDAHRELVELAKQKQLYVWYCAVEERDGKFYIVLPYIVDWDSVPDVPYAAIERSPDHLVCDKCGKACTSTSGLTLHQKKCGM